MNITLEQLGITQAILNEASNHPGQIIGRISTQHRNLYKVITENNYLNARVSGKYAYEVLDNTQYPIVGDWVLLDNQYRDQQEYVISHIINRKSELKRKAPGTSEHIQAMAANIDICFICTSLNNDFNIRRVERYLTIVWDSRAIPVIVLTKSDLCKDIQEKIAQISEVAFGVDVVVTSVNDETSLERLKSYLSNNKTAIFLGSSGVGKSTLINKLINIEVAATNEVRKDDKGRHTTTARQLFVLKSGGIVIDTPGLREIQISAYDMGDTFADIEKLAGQCRFKDCKHVSEPGCAVQKAIADNMLSAKRLDSYHKLKKEVSYQALGAREIEEQKIKNMFGGKSRYKQMMKHLKDKKASPFEPFNVKVVSPPP